MSTILDEAGLAILDEAGVPIGDGLPLVTRTADDYSLALLKLLPSGAAWPKEIGATQPVVAASLAPTYARMDERALELLDDSPAGENLVEMLPEWESTLGLPDPCAGALPTLALRQAAVRARIMTRGGQSVPHAQALAASLGIAVTVTEFRPFSAGDVPGPVYSEDWVHVWRVNAPPEPGWAQQALYCLLTRMKPAHTLLQIAYS